MEDHRDTWDSAYSENSEKLVSPVENADFIQDMVIRGSKLLDVGCGLGYHMEELASRGFQVYGIDISSEAVSQSKERLSEFGLEDHVELSDVFEGLDFEEGFFSFVYSLRVLNHGKRSQIEYALSEIYRVLSDSGGFFVTVSDTETKTVDEIPDVEKVGENSFRNLEGTEKGVVHFLFNRENLKEMLSDAGFEVVGLWSDRGYLKAVCKK